ncbi:MAG: hypothetical protein QNJ90_08695 [Planctomycetota bacterium]|nr:hypothetical protein [Planctomycetota bacterium]
MQRVVMLVLILAVAAGVYFLIASDDSGGPGADLRGDDPSAKGEGGPGLDPAKAKGTEAPAEPKVLQLKSPARLLLIGGQKDSWNHTVLMVCGSIKELSYRSWFLNDATAGTSGVEGPARGMTKLEAKPTAGYLDSEDVRVLVLDNLDPNAFPQDFWDAAARRVTSGRMGLFVRPGFPTGNDGVAQTQSPLLSHPTLQPLLPVKTGTALSGSPLPGVFTEAQSLRPTDLGHRHPATRFFEDPDVSVKAWAPALEGEGALATKFCYPVEDLADGVQILVTCEAASSLPAILATDPTAKTRVLWMGNVDFGFRTHYVRAKDRIQKLFTNHAIVWLAGS